MVPNMPIASLTETNDALSLFGKIGNCGKTTQNRLNPFILAIVQVSADFLRLNGSRQQVIDSLVFHAQIPNCPLQFRSLLSRKKLGQMPPAYTQIDCSYESFDSNRSFCPPHSPQFSLHFCRNWRCHRLPKSSLGCAPPHQSGGCRWRNTGGLGKGQKVEWHFLHCRHPDRLPALVH